MARLPKTQTAKPQPEEKPRKNVTVILERDAVEFLDVLAKKQLRPRGNLLQLMIYKALRPMGYVRPCDRQQPKKPGRPKGYKI